MIKPTVGRVVWYFPKNYDPQLISEYGTPLAAIIARVWNDSMVNLAVFDVNGIAHARTSVRLVQDEDAPESAYCTWMPYQKWQSGQA